MTKKLSDDHSNNLKLRSDIPFYFIFIAISMVYIFLIVSMLLAETTYTTPDHIWGAFAEPEIRYAIWLSLVSCTITTILSLWVSVPIGYLMSRHNFWGKTFIDAVLDIPIVLPPLVIGLCLLILFQVEVPRFEWVNDLMKSVSEARFGKEIYLMPGDSLDDAIRKITKLIFGISIGVTYEIPSVILAQFMVACAFAVRTMRVTFDQIGPRYEQVAQTLGCNRGQAFWRVVFPQAYRGLLAAATLAWARSLGEFGPILIFSGATRMKTEVLPTTVFLELTVGNIEGAVAASLIMVVSALVVLVIARMFGLARGAGI